MTTCDDYDYDVIIIGAGISGISTACHLQKECPNKRFIIIEGRNAIGGTWDLFKYPGVRSDSDMFTLGFDCKPWTNAKTIADGPSILSYINETVDEFNLRKNILLGHKVAKLEWSTEKSQWVLTIETTTTTATTTNDDDDNKNEKKVKITKTLTCRFISMCGGYYDYDEPHNAEFLGTDNFKGKIMHPQFWEQDFDYTDKKVVVIGSGATAMSIVPAMANNGAQHVTMVQRSPTYVYSIPNKSILYRALSMILPVAWASAIVKYTFEWEQNFYFKKARETPQEIKKLLLGLVKDAIGEDLTTKHFTPSYDPWDQRMCFLPNGDLYKVINDGNVDVVTQGIDSFVENGLKLKNGNVLSADIIVTATGLKLKVLSGVNVVVDGKPIHLPDTVCYKGMMLSSIPNMVMTFGYVNASWTRRADLTSEYTCRLLNYMDEIQMAIVTPTLPDMELKPFIDNGFTPGYIMRSIHLFPKQGAEGNWQNTQDYKADKKSIRHGPIPDDTALAFSNPTTSTIDHDHQTIPVNSKKSLLCNTTASKFCLRIKYSDLMLFCFTVIGAIIIHNYYHTQSM